MHPASVSPSHQPFFQRQRWEFSLQLIAPFVYLQNPERRVIMRHKRLNTLIKSSSSCVKQSEIRCRCCRCWGSAEFRSLWWLLWTCFTAGQNLSMHACMHMHMHMRWDGMNEKLMLEMLWHQLQLVANDIKTVALPPWCLCSSGQFVDVSTLYRLLQFWCGFYLRLRLLFLFFFPKRVFVHRCCSTECSAKAGWQMVTHRGRHQSHS